jgi:hypothetical protein
MPIVGALVHEFTDVGMYGTIRTPNRLQHQLGVR